MESLRELYRIGYGPPSSSHTMGPRSAAQHFLSLHADCQRFEADLYGSLAATGKGHLTDKALREVFFPSREKMSRLSGTQKLRNPSTKCTYHPLSFRYR